MLKPLAAAAAAHRVPHQCMHASLSVCPPPLLSAVYHMGTRCMRNIEQAAQRGFFCRVLSRAHKTVCFSNTLLLFQERHIYLTDIINDSTSALISLLCKCDKHFLLYGINLIFAGTQERIAPQTCCTIINVLLTTV